MAMVLVVGPHGRAIRLTDGVIHDAEHASYVLVPLRTP